MAAAPPPDRDVYTISRLNREARVLLERGLGQLWVEGELSNFSQPSSGHWYFTLKDRDAQLRCAMFRQRNMGLRFTPAAGQHVLARGRISLYEPRGDYQLLVDHMEEAGLGALNREFERLKTKLAAEGLFADGAQAPPAPVSANDRRRHLTQRGGDPGHPAMPEAAVSGRERDDLSDVGARRRGGARNSGCAGACRRAR